MKNKGLQLTLIIVLGVLIAGIATLLVISVVGSGKASPKVEAEATQESSASKVNDYALGDYYTNGSTETKAEARQDTTQAIPNTGDYIIEKSATVALTEDDLRGLSPQQLTYARNEIYARHGRPFQSNELRQYFQGKSWYKENAGYNDIMLSSLENANAAFINDYQTKTNQKYDPQ